MENNNDNKTSEVRSSSRIKKYYQIISVIFSLLIVYFLVAQINFQDVLGVLAKVRPDFLIAAFASYFFLNWGRAYRFWILLEKKIGFWELSRISLSHNLINSILPARTGELSYIYYTRKSGKVSVAGGLASLFSARILDTLAVIILMLLSLIFIFSKISNAQEVLYLTIAGFVVILALIIFFIFGGSRIVKILNRLFLFFKLGRFPIGQKIMIKLEEAFALIAQLKNASLFWPVFAVTMLIWLLIFLRVWFIALGFGLGIGFWQSVFVGGLPTLVSIVPFYTIGNFGIFEGSSALAMALLGFEKELAISFSFVLHLVGILIAALPGLWSYVVLLYKSR